MLLTGAQITIETLIEQGCKVLFGYPGGQVIDLYDALYEREDRIKHVLTAHEPVSYTHLTLPTIA